VAGARGVRAGVVTMEPTLLQPRIRSRRIAAGTGLLAAIAAAVAFAGGLPAGLAAQSATGVATHGIAYDVTGAPDAPVVVLIHGFSLDRRMWAAEVAALSDRARVVRYDLRGHGESVPPAEPYAGYDDLRALLDELGVARATLVGLSAGAVVALDFALVFPSRVEALVLAAPGVGGFRAPALPWLEPVIEAARAGDAARAARLWAETPLMAVHAGGAASDAARAMALDNAALWSMARLERPLDPPALDRLETIAAPTLVVVGDRDLPHVLEVAGLLAARIPGAERVVVAGAGHLVNLDAPAAFHRALASFLPLGRVACPGEPLPMATDSALAALRREYMDAFNRGDADAVAALHTEGSVSMSAGLPAVVGRDAIRDLMRASLAGAPPGLRFEFEPVEVRAADGWAVERGVTKPAGPFPAGKYVMLYERGEDGAWRIAWTITNSDAPPPPREP
jgi:3-oxoadipate enol-lactonase